MTERSDPGGRGSGVRLTKEVLRALPPLDRADEATQAIIEGTILAAELLEADERESGVVKPSLKSSPGGGIAFGGACPLAKGRAYAPVTWPIVFRLARLSNQFIHQSPILRYEVVE